MSKMLKSSAVTKTKRVVAMGTFQNTTEKKQDVNAARYSTRNNWRLTELSWRWVVYCKSVSHIAIIAVVDSSTSRSLVVVFAWIELDPDLLPTFRNLWDQTTNDFLLNLCQPLFTRYSTNIAVYCNSNGFWVSKGFCFSVTFRQTCNTTHKKWA